jgi:hypothetical protein
VVIRRFASLALFRKEGVRGVVDQHRRGAIPRPVTELAPQLRRLGRIEAGVDLQDRRGRGGLRRSWEPRRLLGALSGAWRDPRRFPAILVNDARRLYGRPGG